MQIEHEQQSRSYKIEFTSPNHTDVKLVWFVTLEEADKIIMLLLDSFPHCNIHKNVEDT